MARYYEKIAVFLSQDRSEVTIQKKIHYSNYVTYEKPLLEFCLWVNQLENYQEMKKILMNLKIASFCNHSDLFLNYIQTKQKTKDYEMECLSDMTTLTEVFDIYQRILFKYQLLSPLTQRTLSEYGNQNLDYLFNLYGYYLYQEDSPIIEDANNDFYKEVNKLSQKEELISIYHQLAIKLEKDIKKQFVSLKKKRKELNRNIGGNILCQNHEDIKTKTLMRKKRSEDFNRKR